MKHSQTVKKVVRMNGFFWLETLRNKFKLVSFKFCGQEKINYTTKPVTLYSYFLYFLIIQYKKNMLLDEKKRDLSKIYKYIPQMRLWWTNISNDDLKKLIGIILLMGNVFMPKLANY